MAGLRKIKGGKWKVEIRRKGFPSVNKRFHDVKTARKFIREIESQMKSWKRLANQKERK